MSTENGKQGNLKKANHYLPRTYLEGFASTEGQVYIFDRQRNHYRNQTPQAACKQNHLYTIDEGGGRRSDLVEDWFTNHERKLPMLRNKLEADQQLTKADRNDLLLFAASMFARVPETLKGFRSVIDGTAQEYVETNFPDEETGRSTIQQFLAARDISRPVTSREVERMKEIIELQRKSNNSAMTLMNYVIAQAFQHLDKKSIHILCAPEGKAYITSDRPLLPVKADPNALGIPGAMGPGSHCLLPFSSSVLLAFVDGDRRLVQRTTLDRSAWAYYNQRTAIFSGNLLIARSSQQLRSVVEKHQIHLINSIPTLKDSPTHLGRKVRRT